MQDSEPLFLNGITKLLLVVSMVLALSADAILLAQQSKPDQEITWLEFPIQGNSIDAKSFYESVLSKAHWSTELTQKVVNDLNQTDLAKEVNGRISVSALSILTSMFPTAFEFVNLGNSQFGDHPAFFRVNVNELVAKWSGQKLSLRNWISNRSRNPLFEICSKFGFDGHSEKKQLIVVLAGLHGGEEASGKFAAAIHDRTRIPACVFRYPNDAPLDESSEYLLQILTELRKETPMRSVSLVAHSMGGLIVRDTIERLLANRQDALGVDRAILICPPNQGSIFAEYAGVLEFAEQLSALANRNSKTKVLSAILDGFNEAPRDLVPGSEFLTRLQACKRNSLVKYSVLAGDAGFVDPLLALVGNELLELVSSESQQPLQERAKKLLNSAEMQAGSGDGVVALTSAKLQGVDDFESLPINHLEWAELSKSSGQRVLNEIVERITSRSF